MSANRDADVLRKNSFLFDSPTKHISPLKRRELLGGIGRQDDTDVEVIPDSEDERQSSQVWVTSSSAVPLNAVVSVSFEEMREVEELILASSDSDGEPYDKSSHRSRAKLQNLDNDPFMSSISTRKRFSPTTVIDVDDTTESEGEGLPLKFTKSPKKKATRHAVVSDSEVESDVGERFDFNGTAKYDDGILSFDDGRKFRRPVLRNATSSTSSGASKTNDFCVTPGGGMHVISDKTPLQTPTIQVPSARLDNTRKSRGKGPNTTTRVSHSDVVSNPATPCPSSPKKKRAPTKKQLAQAAQEQREAYARNLFADLNALVFDNRLARDTELRWNGRLQTTAGRAEWKRSSDGCELSVIHLAPKILDSEERIRHTLAHEMCHLACWAINSKIEEGHGPLWRSWAQKVMLKRPEIEVTIKHKYEIAYRFTWKCEKCSKVYGRHSKSIDPAKSVCSVKDCQGELIPQFKTNTRAPKKMDSRLASDKPRDSPSSINRARQPTNVNEGDTPSRLRSINSDTETDAEEYPKLTQIFTDTKEIDDENIGGIVQQLSVIDLTGDD